MHQQAVIGLIGGMSWESTVPYYRQVNESVRNTWAGSTPRMWSVDFHEVERLQHHGDWEPPAKSWPTLRWRSSVAVPISWFCTNTMHKVAPVVGAGVASRCST